MSLDCPHTILFIDDNADIRVVLTLGLEQFGYRVIGVNDGAAAFAALHDNPVDLVIIDHGLTGMSGLELGSQILHQSIAPKPPLVLFTGTLSKELESKARESGFADFWTKPMGLRNIRRKIASLLCDNGAQDKTA